MYLIKSLWSLKISTLTLLFLKYLELLILNCNYFINSNFSFILSLKIISILMDRFLFRYSNSSLFINISIIMISLISHKIILISFVSFLIRKMIISFLKMSFSFFLKYLILFLRIFKMKMLRLIQYKVCLIMYLILSNRFSSRSIRKI